MLETPTIEREQNIWQQANQIFQQSPDWISFYRDVLGTHGLVRRNYPDHNNLAEFEKTEEYQRIQQLVAKLRGQNRTQVTTQEPTRVITVRMPQSLHESLRAEAHDRHTSMNKLCISKLIQMIDDQLVPNEV